MKKLQFNVKTFSNIYSSDIPSPKFMGGIKEILGEYGWLPPFDLLWQYGGPMSILAKIIR